MKLLVSPFVWYLLLQAAGLVVLQRRASGRSRVPLRALLLVTLLLAAASTPLTRRGLEASLSLGSASDSSVAPAVVFVLGGGYLPGAHPDEDVLAVESEQRVLYGVTLWRRYPGAHLVFSGASYDYAGIREPDRLAQLMAELALERGVPASAVVLEPRSRNTRDHPIRALALSGVTPATPIAVVTSGWHMRRARREFCRHFQQVGVYPVLPVQRAFGWRDFIPDAYALDANTTLMREWVGLLWYAILGAWERTAPSCRMKV